MLSKIRTLEYPFPLCLTEVGSRESTSPDRHICFWYLFWGVQKGMHPIKINNCVHFSKACWQTHAIKKRADSWSLQQLQATTCPCVSEKQWKSLLSCPRALASPSFVFQTRLTCKHHPPPSPGQHLCLLASPLHGSDHETYAHIRQTVKIPWGGNLALETSHKLLITTH